MMEIKKADSKGRIAAFQPGMHYFVTGGDDAIPGKEGHYLLRPVPTVSEIPEGYEPAEVSAAKNAVLELLYAHEDELLEEDADLIGISDEIVEALLASGLGLQP